MPIDPDWRLTSSEHEVIGCGRNTVFKPIYFELDVLAMQWGYSVPNGLWSECINRHPQIEGTVMRRNMDLIRELMLRLEAYPMMVGGVHHFEAGDEELAVVGFSFEEIDHHLAMIVRAGFVETAGDTPMSGGILFQGLTWAGQDFVDSVRDPEIWAKTKQAVEKAKGFTVELMVELAKGLIKTQIKRFTDVDL